MFRIEAARKEKGGGIGLGFVEKGVFSVLSERPVKTKHEVKR